jgi:hypothetical protein
VNQPQGDREQYYQFLDNFSYTRGAHSLKVGGSVFVARASTFFLSNKDGTFRFTTDAPFNAADLSTYPTEYSQTIGNPLTEAPHEVYAAFFQDAWQIHRNLTLNLGVRYALETTWKKAPLVHVPMDTNDVAPRLGFAWDPSGTGRTVVRGGFGLYYNRTVTDFTQQVTLAAQSEGTITIKNPGYPNPYTRGDSIPTARSTQIPPARVDTPYTRTMSVGAKRDLGGGMAVSVDVVHSLGFNLFNRPDINYPDPVTGVRPNPNFLRINQPATSGHSWSDALLTHFERRSEAGALFSVAYTLSKSLRDVEDFGFVAQDQNNRAAEKGPASTDRRHQIVATVTWPLPGGVQIGALIQARTGLPYDITTGLDNNGDSVFNDRPDVVVVGGDPRNRSTFYSGFKGRVGDLGRNASRGPGYWQLDARASKIFQLRGGRRLECFAEAFNLTNHVNFGTPVGTLTSGSFGKYTGLASGGIPRQVELGLRFDF